MNDLFYTPLCEKLGIRYPIIQGGMAWVATGELAGAVSEAGGLGVIGAGRAPAEEIAEEIDKVRSMTDNPFAVNLMLMSEHIDELVDLVISKEIPIVTTGAGNPGKYMDRLQSAGIKVIPVVSSAALARRLNRFDITAVIAEGNEAGGHIGEMGTIALIPQIADSVDIPVIAAGGIADGRGLLAAFHLGAQAVQMGTRFVCAAECQAADEYKNAIIDARDRDAVVTGRATGHPVRTIKNKLTRKLHKLEENGKEDELEKEAQGALRRAVIEGDIEQGSVMAGQISGMIESEISSEKIIEEIIAEAEEILDSDCREFREGKQ